MRLPPFPIGLLGYGASPATSDQAFIQQTRHRPISILISGVTRCFSSYRQTILAACEMLALRTLLSLATLAIVAAETSVVSLFLLDAPESLVGSVVATVCAKQPRKDRKKRPSLTMCMHVSRMPKQQPTASTAPRTLKTANPSASCTPQPPRVLIGL